MSTGPFAVPTIRWLCDSEHDVDLLVTRPINDAGKRRKSVANPARELLQSVKPQCPIAEPGNVNSDEFVQFLESRQADLLFVCDFGQILKKPALAATRLGGINLHGSLLPQYRGAAPVNWAIYHGETQTGVSVIHMTPQLDAGPTLAQRVADIDDEQTADQLEAELAEIGVDAVRESIERLANWDGSSSLGQPQDPRSATKAPRIKKQQGNLDWNRPARDLVNQVRAFQPWPGSFTHWIPSTGRPVRLIVHRAAVDPSPVDHAVAGTVLAADESGIRVATGEGAFLIKELQPAGKKKMPVAEFLRGRAVQPGDQMGEVA